MRKHKMMKSPPKKKVGNHEKGPGWDQVKIQGKVHDRHVYEKMGTDGVIETHVEHFVPKKKTTEYPRHLIKDKYCGECNAWIIENYKPKVHKKGCKRRL